MISYCFRILIILLLPATAISQTVDDVIFQPSINVSWNAKTRWSFNTAVAQRSGTQDGFEALHIQATQYASYDIGFYSQIGVGIMYRELFDKDRPEEVRFTEQFVYARKYNALKVAQRLRWDQRLRDDQVTHRWRYRLSGSIPLNGFATNSSEFYITASLETVFIAKNHYRPAYDQRFSLGLGRKLNEKLKLQLIAQYRFEDFTADTQRLAFLNLGIYYQI
ncbi:DUF2490 domain-containing protein [uncultured Nonlabens sp.]|uniref:DUF2490 domain-containing protein n=1 Tax=uncultured Nonlabens sp. TaxID=859306 RepID=UPI0026344F2D|nr:DUF2490 domain-containing protein [uncultured Nonlabens sp.]